MTVNPGEDPFRNSLKARLRNRAQELGTRDASQLHQSFLMETFLGRVFDDPDSEWVVRGGMNMLARIPTARHTTDIDLIAGVSAARVEQTRQRLEAFGGSSERDPFEMVVSFGETLTGHASGFSAAVTVTYHGEPYGRFTLDVETEHAFVGAVHMIPVTPLVTMPQVTPVTQMRLYPLEDQVADKTAAMYQTHRGGLRPSTRYRDLIDLALIASTPEIDLDVPTVRQALRVQAQARGIQRLPSTYVAPHETWREGYERATSKIPHLPERVTRLDSALAIVNERFSDVLEQPSPPPTRATFEPSPRMREALESFRAQADTRSASSKGGQGRRDDSPPSHRPSGPSLGP